MELVLSFFSWLILWLILGIIPAVVAASKGRSFFLWLLYGLLIWPIALVHIIVVPDPAEIEDGRNRERCPFCSEQILKTAIVCPNCQRDLPEQWSDQYPTQSDQTQSKWYNNDWGWDPALSDPRHSWVKKDGNRGKGRPGRV